MEKPIEKIWVRLVEQTGKLFPAVLTAILLSSFLCLFARVGSESTPTPLPLPLSLTDSNGDVVTLQAPPKRIVALDSAAVEILFALKEGDRVVGTHGFVSYPPEVKKIEKVGDAFNLNFEKVTELQPDLIYVFFDRFVPELKSLGMTVLYLQPPTTLEEVARRMRMWGQIVDRPEAAEALAREFEQSIDIVRQVVAAVKKGPRVFHYVAPELWTLGAGTLANEVYTLLKAENIFADLTGSQQVSPEAIVARDPQVIISFPRHGPALLKAYPALQKLSAVKQGKLFVLNSAVLSIGGPRLVQGIEQVAKIFYRGLFP
ncbi:ABC transporter substrate-binding protein [Acidobacteria bacterium AH-259-D05]|nr:ABC transporter substrate-binding protein [Acidobacteria bacterium AH-259-D05]